MKTLHARVASWITALNAFSDIRRGSGKLGKYESTGAPEPDALEPARRWLSRQALPC